MIQKKVVKNCHFFHYIIKKKLGVLFFKDILI